MLKKIVFFFVVIVFIANASCKKYPDGPLLSLHSKGERICNYWHVDYFSINGNDSTSYLKGQSFFGYYHFKKASDDRSLFVTGGDCYYDTDNYNFYGEGKWGFVNNKKSISIHLNFNPSFSNGYSIGPFRYDFGSNTIVWDIMRLEQHELWLKTTYNGKEYLVKFGN